MINNYLERQIKENFPYQPTLEQEIAVKSLSEFLLSTLADEVFILRGYAGTGKTSLVGALVKTMDQLQQKSVFFHDFKRRTVGQYVWNRTFIG